MKQNIAYITPTIFSLGKKSLKIPKW